MTKEQTWKWAELVRLKSYSGCYRSALPVFDKGELVGVVSTGDLASATYVQPFASHAFLALQRLIS
jgi:hypothetical protein